MVNVMKNEQGELTLYDAQNNSEYRGARGIQQWVRIHDFYCRGDKRPSICRVDDKCINPRIFDSIAKPKGA